MCEESHTWTLLEKDHPLATLCGAGRVSLRHDGYYLLQRDGAWTVNTPASPQMQGDEIGRLYTPLGTEDAPQPPTEAADVIIARKTTMSSDRFPAPGPSTARTVSDGDPASQPVFDVVGEYRKLLAQMTEAGTKADKMVLASEYVGRMLAEKNRQYRDSYAKAGEFLKLLFPNGIPVEVMEDVQILVRMFDKIMRIVENPNAFDEDACLDLAGYSILLFLNNNARKERGQTVPREAPVHVLGSNRRPEELIR